MRPCTVCSHPEKDAINRALRRGRSIRAVAEKHGLSSSAVGRHVIFHTRQRPNREGDDHLVTIDPVLPTYRTTRPATLTLADGSRRLFSAGEVVESPHPSLLAHYINSGTLVASHTITDLPKKEGGVSQCPQTP